MAFFDPEALTAVLAREDRAAERSDWCPRCDRPDHLCRCNVVHMWPRAVPADAIAVEQPSLRERREHAGARVLTFPQNDDSPGGSSARAA